MTEARQIARLRAEAAGSTLIVVAGLHGNEPAGIFAARRVLARIEREQLLRAGDVVALAGNLPALGKQKRYLARDLNRVWLDDPAAADSESGQRAELEAAVHAVIVARRGGVVVLDLHTSSAEGVPFAVFGDTLAQRNFAAGLPIPAVLGLDEILEGAMCQFWARRGCLCLAVEGGQHEAEDTVANLEAVILLCLQRAGMLDSRADNWSAQARAQLDRRRSGLPRLLEVLERHAVTEADRFQMQPGFRNIDRVKRGQLLAQDCRGELRAREDGLVILPLYQGRGDDGYFWGRAISPLRQYMQAVLRRFFFNDAFGWFLCFGGDSARNLRLLLSAGAANGVRLALLRALGYRRLRRTARGWTVERAVGQD
jgi:succinylglutamate desuccinylase